VPKALNRNNPSMFLQKIWVVAGSRAIRKLAAMCTGIVSGLTPIPSERVHSGNGTLQALPGNSRLGPPAPPPCTHFSFGRQDSRVNSGQMRFIERILVIAA
jgi:hypothetical protein